MRLSFNLRCHAFVAFSPPNFRDKAAPEMSLSMQRLHRLKEIRQKTWECPTKEMPE
jgi:hypothetical protein